MPLSSEATQCRQLTSNGPMLSGFVAKVVKTDGTLAVAGDTGEVVMTRPGISSGTNPRSLMGTEDSSFSDRYPQGWSCILSVNPGYFSTYEMTSLDAVGIQGISVKDDAPMRCESATEEKDPLAIYMDPQSASIALFPRLRRLDHKREDWGYFDELLAQSDRIPKIY
ncbi:hypothetical protein ARMSODRAFT_1008883 [Armillaria solidipes]|uniref:Uncharacterized protein n=1 Tax=Armillaria solidipes TaxID=1076256 RepID=A0A2H3BBX9_9AGAR|nr:hypothetical protein ARMSODRAFT_1008883 [Armillaria solidipes]